MTKKKADLLSGIIRKHMSMCGYTDMRAAAKYAVFGYDTFRRRMSNPANFTAGELSRVAKYFRIPAQELAEVFER